MEDLKMKDKKNTKASQKTRPVFSGAKPHAVLSVIVVALILITLVIVMRDDEKKEPQKKPKPKETPPPSTLQIKPAVPVYYKDMVTFEPVSKDRSPLPAAGLRYLWITGSKLVYDFRLDRLIVLTENANFARELAAQGMSMNYSAGGEMAIRCSGVLTIRVYETSETRCTLGFLFSPVKISIDVVGGIMQPDQLAEMARRLEVESLVDITPQGKIIEIRLDPSLRVEERNFLRDWLSQLQFVLPPHPSDTWQEMESDTTGLYLADYSVTGVCTRGGRRLVLCTKRKYYRQLFLSVTGEEDPAAAQEAVRVAQSGQLEGGIDELEGCLVSLAGQQKMVVTGGRKALPLDVTTTFVTELFLREKTTDVEGVARRFEEISAKKSGMIASRDFAPETSKDLAQTIRAFKIGEATFESVLSELALAESRGQWVEEGARLFGVLLDLFQADEENVRKALQVLTEGQYSEVVLQTLADALAACGRVFAEKGLVRIAADVSVLAKRREIAVRALSSVKDATLETEACLRGLVESGDPSYVATAISSLGWIGSSFSDFDRRARLSSFLETVGRGDRNNLKLALEALGNIGAPAAFGFLRESLQSENEEVRGYAAFAMRKIELPEVDSLLVTTMEQDESSYVRRMAVSALRDRTSSQIVSAVSQRLQHDQDDSVRVEALRYFIDRMHRDEFARRMVEQAMNNPSKAVRELATQAVR